MKILWIPNAPWHIPQRASLFCRVLSETHEVHVTDWDTEYRSPRDYFSRRYLRNFTYRLHRDGKIIVHGIPRISPALFWSVIRRFNSAVFSSVAERIIQQFRIDAVVGTFVLLPPQAPRLVFDVFDDNVAYWRKYGRNMQYTDDIEESESKYLANADAVVAASSVLAERVEKRTTRPIYLIPNGIDVNRFQHGNGSTFRAQWNAPGCIVGVLGNHDRPEEMRTLMEVVDILEKENYTFIVAGRGSAVPEFERNVRRNRISGILFIGKVPMQNAEDIVDAFDIGLCMYSKSLADDARSPMRLFMYAATGLPTVCTDLEEVHRMQLSNVILVEDDPLSIADGIRRARQQPRSVPEQIDKYDIHRLSGQYERILKGDNAPERE